jgi:ATP-dependent exoDNAse (exonuclease V) alpha subunit
LITDPDIRGKLHDLHTGDTNHLVGRLPLVEGMKVIVGLNYDVGSGVVNGSEGILKKVYYTPGPNGEKYASSAVVHIPDSEDHRMPHLEAHEKVVFCETKTFTFRNEHTGESRVITRQQLPLDAAYAITDYKSQGKTLKHVIVDIQSSRMIQSIYVMLSRATSLDGIVILRPFNPKKVCAHAPQSLRDELACLEALSYQTILNSPSESKRHNWAQHCLASQSTQGEKRRRLDTCQASLDVDQPRKRAHVFSDSPIPLSTLFDEMDVD